MTVISKKLARSIFGIWHKVKFWLLTFRKDAGYKEYLQAQFVRSNSKKDQDINLRTKLLVDKIVELSSFAVIPEVLCVGCRNKQELEYFLTRGITNVVGIDLFSESQDIFVMDMHEMTFQDGRFDIVYSSHSLEHSYDPNKVVREIIRVARPNALIAIEVPVHYEVRGTDRFDFGDTETIHKLFGDNFIKALWSEDLPLGHPRNDDGTAIARTIFQISKKIQDEGKNL